MINHNGSFNQTTPYSNKITLFFFLLKTLEILKPSLNLDSEDESTFDEDDAEDDLMIPNCMFCEEGNVNSTSNSLTGLFGKTLKVREGTNEDSNQILKDVSPKSSEMEYIVGLSLEEKKIDHFR